MNGHVDESNPSPGNDGSLEQEKLRAEIERIKAEAKNLRRSAFRKPSTWMPLLVGAAGIITAIGQWQVSSIKAERKALETEKSIRAMDQELESKKQQLAKLLEEAGKATQEKVEAEVLKAQLLEDISALEKTSDALRSANERLRQVTVGTSLSAEEKKVVDKAANAKYSIGLYGLGIDKEMYRSVHRLLEEDGYTIVGGALLTSRPEWLALRSTVFYYDDQAKGRAQALAESMRKVTGQRPGIQKGAGLGVLRGQEEWTFFVHIIGL